jgi:hypothetical protein
MVGISYHKAKALVPLLAELVRQSGSAGDLDQPPLALLALAGGVPVIATDACGLPLHENLHANPGPDAASLAAVICAVLRVSPSRQVA